MSNKSIIFIYKEMTANALSQLGKGLISNEEYQQRCRIALAALHLRQKN